MGTCYDPGLEVFLQLRYPNGDWGQGRRVEPLIGNVDLLPTLLEACGLEVPKGCAGRSFLPLLEGREYAPAEAIFAEKTFHDTYDPQRCVRTERFKYIRFFEVNIFEDLRLATMTRRDYWKSPWRRVERREEELYDLQADPLEMDDLSGDPAFAGVKRELMGRLVRWMRETEDPLLAGPVMSPHYRASLEELLAL